MKNVEKGTKLITCILPIGKSLDLLKSLKSEKNVISANVGHGRGRGVSDSAIMNIWVEVDILTVVVAAAEADEIFEYIYEKSEINRPKGGFMFQGDLMGSSIFALPDVPMEPEKKKK